MSSVSPPPVSPRAASDVADASAALPNLDAVAADVADDPISRPHQILRLIRRSGRKLVITVAGFAVLAAGLAMLVLPGPGLLVIIAGLAILAKEFVGADRLLRKAKARAAQGTAAAKRAFRRR